MDTYNNTMKADTSVLRITEIRWHAFGKETDRVKAMCTIVINGEVVIHEVRVVSGNNRMYIEYPPRKKGDSYVHPINRELGEAWEQTILSAYYKEKKIYPD